MAGTTIRHNVLVTVAVLLIDRLILKKHVLDLTRLGLANLIQADVFSSLFIKI